MANKTLLNTIYLKAKWVRKDVIVPGEFAMEKISDDCLIMLIKDNDTGKSELKMIERPTIDYYVTKTRNYTYPQMYIPENEVEKRTVEYSQRDKALLKELGLYNEYFAMKKNSYGEESFFREREYMQNNVYNSPFLYMADVDIENFYKTKFIEEHGDNAPTKLIKSFFDIEVYIYGATEKVDQDNTIAPISMISYINTEDKKLYGLLLKFDNIPSITEIENDPQSYIDKFIKEDYIEKDPDISFELEFYDSEELLIKRFFQLIHTDKPEFCMAWNSNYDIKYIIGRCKKLNMDINQIFCHPDIPDIYKQFSYKEDSDRRKSSFGGGNTKHFSRYWDWTIAPGYTIFIDQMALYSSLRKRFLEQSYKLNAITLKELKEEKVSLSDYGTTIRNAIVDNYEIFLKYSLRDTFLLYKLEEKLLDCEMVLFLIGNTKFEKGLNISFVITNAFLKMFRETGYVIGNTIDYNTVEKIKGAIVADPMLANVMSLKVKDKASNIYQHIVDFDAASEYPSLMIAFNIGKNATFGKVTSIRDKNTDAYLMDGMDFNQGLQTLSTSSLTLAEQLFGLPPIEEILSKIEMQIVKNFD